MGKWIVHIPSVEHRTGVNHAVLGWLLLMLGAGAFAGMHVAGPLTDRFGARTLVPISATLLSASVILPGLATDAWTLGASLLLLGCGNGAMDVGMNVHAIQVERAYGRPVMSAFHATFSVGGVLAALLGALTLGLGLGRRARSERWPCSESSWRSRPLPCCFVRSRQPPTRWRTPPDARPAASGSWPRSR